MSEPATLPQHSLTHDGETRRLLEIHVPATEVESATAEAARRLGRTLKIPGFRQGHVPARVVRQRFARELEDEVVESLARRHVPAILDHLGEEPVAPPALRDFTLKAGEPLLLVAEFEVQAPVKLGEYRGLTAARPGSSVSDQEVDEALEGLRRSMTRLHPVEGRGAAEGDSVVVEMKGQHLAGPEQGRTFHQQEIALQIGGDEVHPELWGALRDARAGDSRSVAIAYPHDYRTPALAGRRLRYDMTVQSVRQPQVPEVGDDMAREAGDFETLDDLRRRLREDLEQRKRQRAEDALRDALLRQLLEKHPFEVPGVLVEQEVRHRLERLAGQLASQGIDPTQAGIDWKQEKERQEQRAREDLRATRILDAIAEAESIEAPELEVEKHLQHEAEHAKRPVPAVRARWEQEGRLQALRRHLRREAVLDFLISVGHIHNEGESA